MNKLIFTENACYKAGKKITLKGIMVHSTGANNPWLKRYVGPDDGKLGKNQYGNHWNTYHPDGREVCVHAFIGKDNVIVDAREMEILLFDTTALEREHDELLQETQVVSDMVQQSIYENAHVALDQVEYQKRYDDLTTRFDKAKARLDTVTREIQRRQSGRADMEAFIRVFETPPQKLTEFTTESWLGLVDFITVYTEDDIRVTFKNGQEIRA